MTVPTTVTTYWTTICLVSCRTGTVPSTITAIPCFNIYLFAVIFCLYWVDPMLPTFSRRFSPNLSSHFLNFDVLVMISLITFTLISMIIYVQPPRFFFMHRTSPTTTLPLFFSMIWKLQHIMLIKICQDTIFCRNVFSRLF
jgi:hypothetical protein